MAASQKKADQKNGPMKDARAEGTADSADAAQANEQERLSEKKRRELWLYLAVSIVAVELLLVVGAVFYSFISAARSGGGAVPAFPWLMWGSLAVLFPAVILLAVHHADVGLFRSSKNGDGDAEWQAHLPDRMRRLYRVVKGAPAVVVLLGVVLLGGALLTMEGALSALGSLAAALEPHLPLILGGLVLIVLMSIAAAVYLNYRTRRLYAEYEFRREIFEKTGVIIVDKGSVPLPPGGAGAMPYAVLASNQLAAPTALPEATRAAVATEIGTTEPAESPADAAVITEIGITDAPAQAAEPDPPRADAMHTAAGEDGIIDAESREVVSSEKNTSADTGPASGRAGKKSVAREKGRRKQAAEPTPSAAQAPSSDPVAPAAKPTARKKGVIRAPE